MGFILNLFLDWLVGYIKMRPRWVPQRRANVGYVGSLASYNNQILFIATYGWVSFSIWILFRDWLVGCIKMMMMILIFKKLFYIIQILITPKSFIVDFKK